MMRVLPVSLCLAACALAGCANYFQSADRVLGVITPYRIDIVQGNVVTSEQAEKLKVGLSRAQVRDLLGSPMVTDAFHANRWDYVFTLRRQGAEPQRRALVLQFEVDVLKSIETPVLPSEREFVAAISPFKPNLPDPKLALTEAERKALPLPAKTEGPPPEPTGPARTYPPLEKP